MTTPCGLPGRCACQTSYSKSQNLVGCKPAQFWHGISVLKNLAIRGVKVHTCFGHRSKKEDHDGS